MKNKKSKVEFYDRIFKIMIISFVVAFGILFVLPENILDKTLFLIPWYLVLIMGIVCEFIFRIGLMVNAFKIKKYLWALVILFLGTIFPIIFYFSVMKERFEKESNKKTKKKSQKD